MSELITVVLVGVGGYSSFYVNALLDCKTREDYRIIGIVEPNSCWLLTFKGTFK